MYTVIVFVLIKYADVSQCTECTSVLSRCTSVYIVRCRNVCMQRVACGEMSGGLVSSVDSHIWPCSHRTFCQVRVILVVALVVCCW